MQPSTEKSIVQELKQFFYGLAGAVATSLILAIMQYCGAHLPDLIHFIVTALGGYGTIKATTISN